MARVLELRCPVQNYHWGKIGAKSLVYQLATGGRHVDVEEKLPYAELWMGTHPSKPSFVRLTSKPLTAEISANPASLGVGIAEKFGGGEGSLPFLFKVLSVDTALSIQAHPDKARAEVLHRTFSEHYPDANHKPEMAIALTPFEALCNFLPLTAINDNIKNIPELCSLVGQVEVKNSEDLKRCFGTLMRSDKQRVQEQFKLLFARLQQSGPVSGISEEIRDVLQRIGKTYPDDIGCFVVFFLNYLRLKPGEALFLAANEPHAYISGDCVECMACSDNVVRAGLTPKFKDVDTLVDMLTYRSYSPTEVMFKPEVQHDPRVILFRPPISDFAIAKYTVASGEIHTEALPSASICICIEGTASVNHVESLEEMHRGTIVFIPAHTQVSLAKANNLLLFQAFCPHYELF